MTKQELAHKLRKTANDTKEVAEDMRDLCPGWGVTHEVLGAAALMQRCASGIESSMKR